MNLPKDLEKFQSVVQAMACLVPRNKMACMRDPYSESGSIMSPDMEGMMYHFTLVKKPSLTPLPLFSYISLISACAIFRQIASCICGKFANSFNPDKDAIASPPQSKLRI